MPDADLAPPPSLSALFLGYAGTGLLAFGGAAALVRRMVVEERRWMTERDYAEVIGLGQVLPGPNVGNAAIMVGRRFHGLAGAIVATAGLYAAPLAILVGLMLLWQGYAHDPRVGLFMQGVACAAAGMVIGTALRMTERLRPPPELLLVTALAAIGGAWLRLPLPLIVLGLAPLSVAAVVWRRRRGAGGSAR